MCELRMERNLTPQDERLDAHDVGVVGLARAAYPSLADFVLAGHCAQDLDPVPLQRPYPGQDDAGLDEVGFEDDGALAATGGTGQAWEWERVRVELVQQGVLKAGEGCHVAACHIIGGAGRRGVQVNQFAFCVSSQGQTWRDGQSFFSERQAPETANIFFPGHASELSDTARESAPIPHCNEWYREPEGTDWL